jgi:oxygen-independent coproporphyrinogen-3 oxidase
MASIYIHIPFCEHKCIYCDFYSIAPSRSKDEHRSLLDNFLVALEKEIILRADIPCFKEPIETIFFGGGTPSLLRPSEIERLLNLIASRFTVQSNVEITLETNPGTVDKERLGSFKSAGINRISLGIQSFNDDELKFLTRIHTASEAKKCISDTFAVGIKNISFDLIFSLPGQTMDTWISNLKQAVEFEPTHISSYSLILEPQTPLFEMVKSGQVVPLEEELTAEMYEFTIEFLASHGYKQYEISNFAKESFKCRHNINYWNHTGYLGFGPSAHSFWQNERWWNVSDIGTYIRKISEHTFPLSGGEHLTNAQLIEEAIFLGLRSEGIDLENYRQRFMRDLLAEYKSTVTDLIKQGYASSDNGRFSLTAKGYVICDEICQSFR